MDHPSVSVVIPFHNKARWVGRAIRSVQWQTAPAAEIVLVDDASPDALPEGIRDVPGLRVMTHAVNLGAAAARNTGVAACRGELVAFLDADDYWLPDKLRRQTSCLAAAEAAEPGDVAVATGFFSSKSFSRAILSGVPRASADPAVFASGCWFCPGSTVLIRREAFLRHGPYDTRLKRLEDTLWFFRFALQGGRLVSVPSIESIISQDGKPGSATLADAAEKLERAVAELVGAGDSRRRVILRRIRAYADLEIAASAWYEQNRFKALLYLSRSLMRAPRAKLQLEPLITPLPLTAANLGLARENMDRRREEIEARAD